MPHPKISIGVMILASVLTLGLYQGIWVIRRAREMNRMPGGPKIGMLGPIILLSATIFGAYVIIYGLFGYVSSTWNTLNSAERGVNIVVALVATWTAMNMRRKLESYGATTNALLCFLLNIYYIQYKINRLPRSLEPQP
jgi:hypothetical protein